MEDKQKVEKKNFHLLNEDIVNTFKDSLEDPTLQSQAVRFSNMLEDKENNYKRDDRGDR